MLYELLTMKAKHLWFWYRNINIVHDFRYEKVGSTTFKSKFLFVLHISACYSFNAFNFVIANFHNRFIHVAYFWRMKLQFPNPTSETRTNLKENEILLKYVNENE